MPEIGRDNFPGITITGDGIIKSDYKSATTKIGYQSRVVGDTVNRFQIDASGKISWGPGNAALDTYFERSAASTLKTADELYMSLNNVTVIRAATSDHVISGKVTGDTQNRITIWADGTILIGNGTNAPDCVIRRRDLNIISCVDRFEVDTLGVNNHAAANTLGNVQNKFEVFDTLGNSIGFVPLYDAITQV